MDVRVRRGDQDRDAVLYGSDGFVPDGAINVPLGSKRGPALRIVEFINKQL
jgi:hypothetical protein